MWSGGDHKSQEGPPGLWGASAGVPLSSRLPEEYHPFAGDPFHQQTGGSQITCHTRASLPVPPGREFGDMYIDSGLSHKPPSQAQQSQLQMDKTMQRRAGYENPLVESTKMPSNSHSHMFKTFEHGDPFLMFDRASSLKGCGEKLENISKDSSCSILKQRIHALLTEEKSILWSDLLVLYKQTFAEDLPEAVLTYVDKWTDICNVKRFGSGNSASSIVMLSPDARLHIYNNINPSVSHPFGVKLRRNLGNMVKGTPPQSLLGKKSDLKSPLNDVLKQQLINLHKDHPRGIWLKQLPRLFLEKYDLILPEKIVENYECLSEIFDVDRPLENDPNTVILHLQDNSEVTVAPAVFPNSEFTFGKIIFFKDCEEFYIQFQSDFLENDLKSISKMLHDQHASGKKELATFLEGTFCSFERSGNWYRGQIQSVDEKEDSAVVFAVDYGFTSRCIRTKLWKLPSFFTRHRAQCVRCRLRPMAAHGTRWTCNAVAELRALNEPLKVKVEEVKEDSAMVVLHTTYGVCVNERLCVQIPSLALSKGDVVTVSFVTAESTDNVIVRCYGGEYACKYIELNVAMNLFYGASNGITLPCVSINELVAVNAEERGWLRASVVNVSDNNVEVMCLDLGLLLDIMKSDVYQLEEIFCNQPKLVLACQLAGLKHFYRDKAVLNCLSSLARDDHLQLNVLKESPKPLVVLYDHSGVSINAACLRALEDKHLSLELAVNVTYRNVCIQHVTADGMLFCQTKTHVKKLDKILSEVEEQAALLKPAPYVFNGMRCLVKHLGKPVRAEVLHVKEEVVEVCLTDYCQIAQIHTSKLFRIESQHVNDLVEIPPQVVKCRLVGADMEHLAFPADILHRLRWCVTERHSCVVKVVSIDSATAVSNIYLFIKDGKHFEETVNYTISRARHSSSNAESSPSSETLESFQQQCAIGKNGNDGTESLQLYDQERFAFHKPSSAASQVQNYFQLPERSLHAASAPQQETLPPLQVLPLGKMKQVYVSTASLPNQFVLQVYDELPALDRMMNEMTQYYRNIPYLPAIDVQISKIYAAKCEDGRFYRVVVKDMISRMANVYLLDYGRQSVVSVDRFLHLPVTFKTLPVQGLCAELFGDFANREWSPKAARFFRKRVNGRILWAQIMEVHEDPNNPLERNVCVNLIDTVLDNEVHISQLMLAFKS